MIKLDMNDLMTLRQSGVYCLVNEGLKCVQVFASRNMLDSLNNVMKKVDSNEYGNLRNELNNIDILVLEVTDYYQFTKVLMSKWIDRYRNDGYKLYKESNLVSYRVMDSPGLIEDNMYYLVYLENTRKDKLILGVFDNKDEGLQWKKIVYPGDIIDTLVFCENKYKQFTNYTI